VKLKVLVAVRAGACCKHGAAWAHLLTPADRRSVGANRSRSTELPRSSRAENVEVPGDVDGLRPGDVDRLRRGSCTACGGEPAAPEVVHRLRRGAGCRGPCTACGAGEQCP
jgi:hypothetical protein